MGNGGESRLDGIARDLASGTISRRSALKRLAGIGLGIGAAVAPAGVAEAMGGGCPGNRVKCQGKCCPTNAKCKNGKCKCKSGFTKCGKKCVDTDASVKHCGACGNRCETGETCVDGVCTAADLCGDGIVDSGEQCDDGNTVAGDGCDSNCQIEPGFQCTGSPSVCTTICGDDIIAGAEVCDRSNLGGETCQSQGFTGGMLACAAGCAGFDTSGCFSGTCQPGATQSCYTGPASTQDVGVCQAGIQTCTQQGEWGPCEGEVTPSQESCDGLDNDCDGVVDNDSDGESCFCGAGVPGLTACVAGAIVCQC